MGINTSSLGGGALVKLAPDLTYPADKVGATNNYKNNTVSVTAGVSSTTLTLTGKYAVNRLWYSALISETNTYYMEVDGVIIFNDVGAAGTSFSLYGFEGSSANSFSSLPFEVNEELILKITTVSDTSVDINYDARKIL
jgi:hypothetical protein